MRFKILWIFLFIIFFSFPSICFSELKTVEGEYCDVFLGDMKNKKELEKVRKSVTRESIKDGLRKHFFDEEDKDWDILDECVHDIITQYLEKVVVISHTKKGRKICEKVELTLDPDVIKKYLSQKSCKNYRPWELYRKGWSWDINDILTKKNDKINIGLIIETKIPDLDGYKKETLENEEEKHFHKMIELKKDKYKVIDRRHLTKILDEQKLSSSGITDSDTIRLGKILNLDIIVLRLIYENSKVTKVMKVDTGEVLLFKTYYETETNNTH